MIEYSFQIRFTERTKVVPDSSRAETDIKRQTDQDVMVIVSTLMIVAAERRHTEDNRQVNRPTGREQTDGQTDILTKTKERETRQTERQIKRLTVGRTETDTKTYMSLKAQTDCSVSAGFIFIFQPVRVK